MLEKARVGIMTENLFSIEQGESFLAFPHDYVVIDTETTGLKPEIDEIIEITALKYSCNKKIAEFSTLVKPQRYISSTITDITGITNEMVDNAPSIADALGEFLQFVEGEIVLGYNIGFDLRFLNNSLAAYNLAGLVNDTIDVLHLAKIGIPGLNSYKQTSVAGFLGISTIGAHRAAADCEMCNSCYQKLKELYYFNFPGGDFSSEGKPLQDKKICLLGNFKRLSLPDLQLLILSAGGGIFFRPSDKIDYYVAGGRDDFSASELEYIAELKQRNPSAMIFREAPFLEALGKRGYQR